MESEPSNSMELPRPIRQEGHISSSEIAPSRKIPERQISSGEGKSSGSIFNPPIPVAQSNDKTSGNPVPQPNSDLTSLTSSNPVMADDVDVIEKEWVQKAKQIVEKTKQDPYQQNKEMNVFKADYMKKRYGKDLKLTGE